MGCVCTSMWVFSVGYVCVPVCLHMWTLGRLSLPIPMSQFLPGDASQAQSLTLPRRKLGLLSDSLPKKSWLESQSLSLTIRTAETEDISGNRRQKELLIFHRQCLLGPIARPASQRQDGTIVKLPAVPSRLWPLEFQKLPFRMTRPGIHGNTPSFSLG